ncbi:phosphonate ABC transporter ATP-binding protein [Bordetella sp. 2513F-2]
MTAERPAARDADSILLSLRGLAKRYPTGDLALDHVDLDLPPGQVLALIGPSGAGKSTLIRCINRLVEPSSGDVLLQGRSLPALGTRALRHARRQLGMIFQEYALIERLTVMENVLSGRLGYVSFWRSWARRYPAADVGRAFHLLERVGLTGFENKRADALSGGQRQRVGIARALMQDPLLLLVDEPTASLDPKTSRQIMRLVCEICRERGLSAIINIHDVGLATQFADRIVGLRKGQLVYDGSPAGLDSAVLTAIYGEEDWNTSGAIQQGAQARQDAGDMSFDGAAAAA